MHLRCCKCKFCVSGKLSCLRTPGPALQDVQEAEEVIGLAADIPPHCRGSVLLLPQFTSITVRARLHCVCGVPTILLYNTCLSS